MRVRVKEAERSTRPQPALRAGEQQGGTQQGQHPRHSCVQNLG